MSKFYLYAFEAWRARIFRNNRWRMRLNAYDVMSKARRKKREL